MAKSHLEKYLGRRRRTMFVHSGANVTFPVMSVVAFFARKNTPQRTVCYRFTDGDRTVRTHSGWRGSVKHSPCSSRRGGVSPPGAMSAFLLSCLPEVPSGRCLSQTGQCTRDPAVRATDPSQSDGAI